MKLSYVGIAGISALVLALSFPVFAATPFTVTGIVDVRLTNKLVYVTATKASSEVKDEVLNKNIPYSISKSTVFYKYVNNKLTKVGAGTVKLGQEVVVKGSKVGSTYKVTSLTINDRNFVITGIISDVDKTNNQIKVAVKTSSYKQSALKGTDVITTYSAKTVCKEGGNEIGCSTIDADGQKITLKGGVIGTENKYVLLEVINKK